MKKLLFLLIILPFAFSLKAQPVNCVFKEPVLSIHFGSGVIRDLNSTERSNYYRVPGSCPTDGHYTYTSYTSQCFRGDWLTLTEDHTPGDADGNMMLVNASYASGTFLTTPIHGSLKPGATYEFSVWMMNVCRPTDKCPYPLLPNISIVLMNPDGKVVAQFGTGELVRRETPQWTRYQALFTMPPAETPLILTMINNAPGGCGNDFALDDISFRECVKPEPIVKKVRVVPKAPAVVKKQPVIAKPLVNTPAKAPVNTPVKAPVVANTLPAAPKTTVKKDPPAPVNTPPVKAPVVVNKLPAVPKTAVKKESPPPVNTPVKAPVVVKKLPSAPKTEVRKEPEAPVKKQVQVSQVTRPQTAPPADTIAILKPKPPVFPPPPPVLTTRANAVIRQIETEPGEIRLDLYDNGQVDGDTVTVYHNNVLLVSHSRISEKPISFRITIDAAHPHHELVMVADNLGSIPPNTSLMVVNTGTKRYEVFISSTEHKNAKVIFDLKE